MIHKASTHKFLFYDLNLLFHEQFNLNTIIMKKKSLKTLKLHTYKISNLTLLHAKVGGTLTTTTTATNPTDANANGNSGDFSGESECTADETSLDVLVCTSLYITDCATNGSATKVPPPTEIGVLGGF